MTDSLTLFSGLVVRKAFDDELIHAFESRSGIQLRTVFDPTVQLISRIGAGETFDVMIGATPSFDELGASGIVDSASVTPFVRTGLGLGVAPGAPKPDISTVDALVAALRSARSVAYSRSGQSGIYFLELVERLGIADEVLARATALEKGFTATALMDGTADLAIQQVSELMFVPGTELVGFLPEGAQKHTEFSAAISATSSSREAAGKFIDFIASPDAAEAYLSTHLEPVVS